MNNYYERAIYCAKNPINDLTKLGFKKQDYSHNILYEWKIDKELWCKAIYPLKKIYIKDSLGYILFFLFCFLVSPVITAFIGNDIHNINISYKKYIEIYIFSGFIFVPIIILIIIKTIKSYHFVCSPNDCIFFMTNVGIFNGRVYETKIKKYRLVENENKFCILLTQCSLGNISGGSGPNHLTYGTGGKTHTFWNNFYYNDDDKKHIYLILAMWENCNIIEAENYLSYNILHDYI